MRFRFVLSAIGTFIVAGCLLIEAATLEDRKLEWTVSLSAVDANDVGSFFTYDFELSSIFRGGYNQIGFSYSFVNDQFDDPFLADVVGSLVGLTYQFNWTPNRDLATGFAFGTLGLGVGSGVPDDFQSIGVGVKVFVGDSAAIRVFYSLDRIGDLDVSGIAVGISLYSH